VLDAGGATPVISLGGNITALGGNRAGTGSAGAGGSFHAKDATTNTANVTINTTGGTTGGAGGSIRFDGATNEDASARTLTLTAGTGAITLTGGAATNAVTTLTASGGSIALGSVQTKGAQAYTGATALNGALAATGTAAADTVTFNSPVTLAGNSSITTAGGSGDNLAISQTINGNYALALDAGALGTVSTSAIIGGSSALAAFSANGAAVTFGRSVTAGSIFARSGTGNITLNTGGTVLTGTGTGNAVELVVAGSAGRFVNNVGAGAINASSATGRFLVWSQDPADDTRGGLAFGFKQYGATYGVTTVADSNPNSNGFLYTVSPTITAGLIGTVAKTYDGNDVAALTAGNFDFSGAIDGDTVTVAGPTSGSYVDKHAGSTKMVTADGFAIDSAGNGAATVYGYTLASTSATANIGTINQRALTVSAVAGSKVYNGSTASGAAPTHAVLQGGDTASFSQSYNNRNAGAGKTLTASGVVDDGNGGANYSYTFVGNNAGVITPAALTVTAQTDSRGYDGTTASALAPIVSGTLYDSVDMAATQQFGNKNAGSNKRLTASGLVIDDGNGGNNYAITYVADNTGAIARAGLTVTAQTDSRGYNGTTASNMTPIVSGTLYDSIDAAATQQFANKHAGSGKALNASGLVIDDGNGGNNYAITYVADNTGAIARAALTVTAQADSRGYNGSTASSVAPIVSGTLYDSIDTPAAQQFANKHAGSNKTLNAGGLVIDDGNGGDNYTINYVATTSGAIARAALTVTAQADNRIYDGTTASIVAPILSGTLYDSIDTAAMQQFANKNAGSNKTLNASGLVVDDGNGGNNYAVNYVAAANGTIGKAALNLNATSDAKVYDGSVSSSGAVTAIGLRGGDTVTGAMQQFTSKNVRGANGSTLQVGSFAVNDGNGGGNYDVVFGAAAGTISPATLSSVTGIVASDKVYDANITAALDTDAAILHGLIGADSVSVAAVGNFLHKNAGSNKTVAIAGITLAGADAGNYVLADTTATSSATIHRREISIAASDASKIYGNSDPLLAYRVGGAGLAGDETLADVFTGAMVRAAGENVAGGPYAIRQGTLAANGNYAVTTFAPGRLIITPRPLTIAADDRTGRVATAIPIFTATYEGFAFADDPASLQGALIMTTDADAMSTPGIYAIEPSGQASSNYMITYLPGTLLVTPGRMQALDSVLPAIYAAGDWMPRIADDNAGAGERRAASGCDAGGAAQGDGAGAPCAGADSSAEPEPQLGAVDRGMLPARGFPL
jgi:hypothetical protein